MTLHQPLCLECLLRLSTLYLFSPLFKHSSLNWTFAMLTTWLKSNYWMNGKTAFNTHLGHFEYLVIHPLFFQVMVNGVLRDCLNRFVFVLYCLDNILIFSKSLYEHESQICLVLQCLLENELFIKGENCEYHTDSISLFGYIVE